MPVLAIAVTALLLQQPDSVQLLRRVRAAQAAFETTRRFYLPLEPIRQGRCDEIIGRFCYWYEEDRPAPRDPPPEPEPIKRARDVLLGRLDSAAALLPGDDWIAGQRVRYLAEAGRNDAATQAARTCNATPWWCAALTGLARHLARDYAGAESAFADAFNAMPADLRCRWMDLSSLLEGDMRRRYRSLDCDARAAFAERVWWLARPLASRPGNDRKTEHYARAAYAHIESNSRSPYHLSWADDLRELEMRYGWSTYWTQHTPRPGSFVEPVVSGHEPEPAYHFLPDQRDSVLEWRLDGARPRERYAPVYVKAFVPLEHQIAVFRRVHACVVVASYDMTGSNNFGAGAIEAALVLARDERNEPVIERLERAAAHASITAAAACDSLLFSLEVFAPEVRRAARARAFIQPPAVPPNGIALSDVLLFDPPSTAAISATAPGVLADSLPADLPGVIPFVCGSRATTARSVGLFWETYGLNPAGEDVRVAVTVMPSRTGWLRRTAGALGIARPQAAIRLEWQERARVLDEGVAPRALALDLAGLSRGSYRVEVAVETETSRAVRATEITIARP